MDSRVKQHVRRRARFRCEYCLIREEDAAGLVFHVEHIVAKKHGGNDDDSNLALDCDRCNLHKGPNIAGIDHETGKFQPLFNPRTDNWNEHFQFVGFIIGKKTPSGRATVNVLDLNAPRRLQLRAWLARSH